MFFVSIFFREVAVSFVRVFFLAIKKVFSVNGEVSFKTLIFLFFFCMFSLRVFFCKELRFFLQRFFFCKFFSQGMCFFMLCFFGRRVFFKKRVFVSKGFNLIFVSGVFFSKSFIFFNGVQFFRFFHRGLGFYLKMFWSFQTKRFEILQRIFSKKKGLLFPEVWCGFLSKGIVFFFGIGFQFFEGMFFVFQISFVFFFCFSGRRNFLVFLQKVVFFQVFLFNKWFSFERFFLVKKFLFEKFSSVFFRNFSFFQMFFVSMFFFQIVLKQRVLEFFLGKNIFSSCKFFGFKETFIVTKKKWLFSLLEGFFFFFKIFFSKFFVIFLLLGGFSFNKQVS